MKANVASLVVVVVLALGAGVRAEDTRTLQNLSEHVYAYVDAHSADASTSFAANAGVVVGNDAALVVDTLISAKDGARFLADIRKVTDKPVKYVVNTHHHLDHAWGNGPFADQGAVIIGHEATARDLPKTAERMAHPEASGFAPGALDGTRLVPPTVCFSQRASVDLGGVTVELNFPGPTHTAGSITAYVPQDKTLFTGDILFVHCHPFLAEGDFENWPKVLDELAALDAARIIPGHGPLATKTDLAEMKTYIQEFDKLARKLCEGKQASDAPAIAEQLIKALPQQQRTELARLVEGNLRMRYLPQPKE